jgi:mevalonate pyrophosphate decarboxylase
MDSVDDDGFKAELYSTFYYESAEHIGSLASAAAAASPGACVAQQQQQQQQQQPIERRVRDAVRPTAAAARTRLVLRRSIP